MLDDEYQRMAANAIAHEAWCAGQAIQQAAFQYERPSAVWKPSISIDGDHWCALYGEDLQSGIAGFGKSPELAMYDFDAAWYKKIE